MRPSPSTSAISPRRDAPSSRRGDGSERVCAGVRVDLHRAPARELHADVLDDRARELERHGRGDVTVDALGIRRAEDFLGRDVRGVPSAVDRLEVARRPVRRREQPDGQIGSGPVEPERVVPLLREPLGIRLQGLGALDPRLGRVVLVEAADVRDVLPQLRVCGFPLEVGVDELRPRPRWHRDDVPARRHTVHDFAGLREIRQQVAAGACGVEPLERARRLRAGERDAGCVLVREIEQPFLHPRGCVVQRVLGGVGDALTLQPLVEVEDVDVLRSAQVRRARDLPRHLFLPDVARDGHELPGLDVGAEDGELREPVRQRLDAIHAGRSLARMPPCASMPTSPGRASRRAVAPTSSSATGVCA